MSDDSTQKAQEIQKQINDLQEQLDEIKANHTEESSESFETKQENAEKSKTARGVVLRILAGLIVCAAGCVIYMFGNLSYMPSLPIIVIGGTLMALPVVTGITSLLAASRKKGKKEPGIMTSFWLRLVISIILGFIVYLITYIHVTNLHKLFGA